MFRRLIAGDRAPDDRTAAGDGIEKTGMGRQDEQDREKEEIKFDCIDVLAFTIATFEIILPMLVAFVGIILFIYLLLRLLAR